MKGPSNLNTIKGPGTLNFGLGVFQNGTHWFWTGTHASQESP